MKWRCECGKPVETFEPGDVVLASLDWFCLTNGSWAKLRPWTRADDEAEKAEPVE